MAKTEAALKTAEWEEARRRAGYKRFQIWLPIEVIADLTVEAHRQRQDMSVYITSLVEQSKKARVAVIPPAPEMKTCKQGHQYPKDKHGCNICSAARKRRQRARERA